MNNHLRKWLIFSPIGLALIGLGVSIVGDAATRKAKGRRFREWFPQGTLGLIILNTGVAVFGEAVKSSTLRESRKTPH
jgi:hypothetical protein